MRNIITAGLLLAGFSAAQAQTITPGIGGVAVTGQSGAGLYLPYGGGGVTVGSPGLGSYQLGGGGYTSPYSWNQFSNPTAYNFNTGGFNYNSGVYGFNNGFYSNGGFNNGQFSNGNVIRTSGYNTYPSNYGYGNNRGSSFGNSFGSSVYTPVINTNGRGRVRFR